MAKMNVQLMRQKGIDTIEMAVSADNDRRPQEAFNFYVQGIGQLMLAIKYEKNKTIKHTLLLKISSYIDRAEQLKQGPPREASTDDKGIRDSSDDVKRGSPIVDSSDTDKQGDAISTAIKNTKLCGSEINVTWDDVIGLVTTKASLYEAVILPKRFPSMFTGKRKPWSAILLYGPPGTGKSFLAKAVAHESKSTFFSISSADIMSKWQGESEKTVTMLFKQARADAPSVIFIDEVDSMAGERSDGEQESTRRVKTQLLMEMQGVGTPEDGGMVMVLAATNTPWSLDSAFRRRFQRRIYVPLPDMVARTEMFKKGMGSDMPHTINGDGFKQLGKMTNGYSGSDITNVIRSAMMEPIRKCRAAKQFISDDGIKFRPVETYPNCSKCPMDLSKAPSRGKVCGSCGAHCKILEDLDSETLDIPPVTMDDMLVSMKSMSKTVSEPELNRFDTWTEEFGQDGS